MHNYVRTLGTVIRKAHEERGMSQASLVEKLGIDVRTIINIENFHRSPKFEVFYPLVTISGIPADCILYPETDSTGNGKQQLFREFHSLSGKEVLELPPVIRCLAEVVRKYGLENP